MAIFSRRQFFICSGISLAGASALGKIPEISSGTSAGKKGKSVCEFSFPEAGIPLGERCLAKKNLECDVLVAGGGLAGVAAALSAARNGAKVILCQDRSRLGGNSSSEVKMNPCGLHSTVSGFREGGIIDELKLDCAVKNPQYSFEIWDLLLYDKVVSEKNISLFLDTSVCRAETSGGKITRVWARCETSYTLYNIKAKFFIDCTGDARLAAEAGDDLMRGNEPPEKFGESLAGYEPVDAVMGSSIMFTAVRHKKPMRYIAPEWARKITPEMIKFRKPSAATFGYWWLELGGDKDTIGDNERIRFELLSLVMGLWDYVKNSGNVPDAENLALESVGMVPGRRESYRIVSEYIFTENDIQKLGWKNLHDGVAVGGWPLDDHPKGGFNDFDKKPCRQAMAKSSYNIPFGSLFSKKFSNLLMAGRDVGVSHVALTSVRVMTTCAAMGQAVGTAAAMCVRGKTTPTEIRNTPEKMKALQQNLLKDGQSIYNVKNEDPLDMAREASVSGTKGAFGSKPEYVLTGVALDRMILSKNKPPRPFYLNRWVAPMSEKPYLELAWNAPKRISEIHVALDAGNRVLSITASEGYKNKMVIGAQPETLKDFDIVAVSVDGAGKTVVSVRGNWQRLLKFKIEPTVAKSLRLHALATNGSKYASVFEIRVY